MEAFLKSDGYLTLALMVMALGLYLVYQGYTKVVFFIELRRRGQTARARIIGLQRYVSSGNPHSVEHIHPLFSYQIDGKWYETEAEEGLFLESFRIGQEMEVRFLPENPQKITWRKTGTLGIGGMLFGLSITTFGIWLMVEIGKVL